MNTWWPTIARRILPRLLVTAFLVVFLLVVFLALATSVVYADGSGENDLPNSVQTQHAQDQPVDIGVLDETGILEEDPANEEPLVVVADESPVGEQDAVLVEDPSIVNNDDQQENPQVTEENTAPTDDVLQAEENSLETDSPAITATNSGAVSPASENQASEVEDASPSVEPQSDSNPQPAALPDPYFFVSGVKHSYLPSGGDCTGIENCAVSSTPIQDAINAVSGGLNPDDDTIYIEGGIYQENVSLIGFDHDLTLAGSANGADTILEGSFYIGDTARSITLRQLNFNAGIVAIHTNLNIEDSTLNAGLAAVNSNVALVNSTANAGVAQINSQVVFIDVDDDGDADIAAANSTIKAANTGFGPGTVLQIENSLLDVTGTPQDDVVEVSLVGGGGNTVSINNGEGNDTIILNLNDAQSQVNLSDTGSMGNDSLKVFLRTSENVQLSGRQVTSRNQSIVFDQGFESLLVAAEGQDDSATVAGDLAFSGQLEISAATILVNANIAASQVVLNAGGDILQTAGSTILTPGAGGILFNAGLQKPDANITILGDVLSERGAITFNAPNDVTIGSDARIASAGKLTIHADSNGDGSGSLVMLGDVNITNNAIAISAADIQLEGDITSGSGDIQLAPSADFIGVFLGTAFVEAALNLGQLEFRHLVSSGMVLIGGFSAIGDITIGALNLSEMPFDLTVQGGTIALGNMILAASMTLQLLAAGAILDINRDQKNLSGGGLAYLVADTIGALGNSLDVYVSGAAIARQVYVQSYPTGDRSSIGGTGDTELASSDSDEPPLSARSNLAFRIKETIQITVAGSSRSQMITLAGEGGSSAIAIAGFSGDDTLVVDFSQGNPIPAAGLTFDGGAGFDSLSILGGAFDTVAYRASSPNSGDIYLDGAQLHYINIEPIDDFSVATNVTFTGTAGNDTITLVNGALKANGSTPCGVACIEIQSPQFENIIFANKTNVIVNGGGGNDIITLNFNAAAAGLASLIIQGGAGADTFLINSAASLAVVVDGGTGTDALAVNGTVGSVINMESLTLSTTANLMVNIGGMNPGDFSQVHISGLAVLSGTLSVTFINNFVPTVADRFDILLFGSVSGSFDASTGLFGFGDGSQYLAMNQQADRITLVSSNLPGGSGVFFRPDAVSDSHTLGEFFNRDYFPGASPTLEISGEIRLNSFLAFKGTFTFGAGFELGVEIATGVPANVGAALGAFGLDAIVDAITAISGVTVGENFSTISGWDAWKVVVGASNLSGFVGLGDPDFSDPNWAQNDDLFGFILDGVDLGLALMHSFYQDIPGLRNFIGLSATASTVAFTAYGSDWMNIALNGLSIVVNDNLDVLPGDYGPPVIDWANTNWDDGDATAGLQVGASTIGWDGNQRLGVSAENAVIDLLSFLHLKGSFFWEKGPQQLVEIATGVPANVGAALGTFGLDTLADSIAGIAGVDIGENFGTISGWDVATTMLGMSGVMGFAGFGDPDFNDPNWAQSSDLLGFILSDLDLALGIMESTFDQIQGLKQFIGLSATAGTVAFTAYGSDWLNIEANNVSVVVNDNPDNWPGGFGPAVIDWSNTDWNDGDDTAGLQVPTGAKNADGTNGTMTIGWDGNQRIGVSSEMAVIDLLDFIHLKGSFFFEKGPQQLVEIATGIPANLGALLGSIGLDSIADTIAGIAGVDIGENFGTISGWDVATMMLGMSGVMGFAGFGSPDFSDPDWAKSDDLFGFILDDMDLALGIMESTFDRIQGLKKFIGLSAAAGTVAFTAYGSDWLNLSAQNVEVVLNDNPDNWPGDMGPAVIDWANTDWNDGDDTPGLQVPTGAKNPDGTNKTMTIGWDGNQRIGVSSELARIDLLKFLHLQGSFFFEKGPQQLVEIATGIPLNIGQALGAAGLDDVADSIASQAGVTIGADFATISGWDVATMMLGMSNVMGFAGFGDPDFSDPNWADDDDLFGVILDDLNVALGIMESTFPIDIPGLKRFIGLHATAKQAAFVTGGSDIFEVSVKDVEVIINTNSNTWPGGLGPAVIDWGLTDWNDGDDTPGLQVPTGARNPDGSKKTITLDMDGNERIGVSVGEATLLLADFIYLTGSLAFEMGPTYTIDINTGVSANLVDTLGLPSILPGVQVSTITLGGSHLKAFVGLDAKEYFTKPDDNNSIGFAIDDLTFGIAIMTPTVFDVLNQTPLKNYKPRFISLKATAEFVGFVGFGDFLTLEAHDLLIEANVGPMFAGNMVTVDLASSFPADGDTPAGFAVKTGTGTEPVYLDYSGELLRASSTQVTLSIYNFVYFTGSFALEMGPRYEMDINTGVSLGGEMQYLNNVEMKTLTIGMSNVYAFFGWGPYYKDTNKNGRIDEGDTPDDSAIGFAIENLDFGMVMMNPTIGGPGFMALKVNADVAHMVGLGDAFILKAYDLEMELNSGISFGPFLPMPTVDFKKSFETSAGANDGTFEIKTGGDPVVIDFSGELTRLVVGYAELSILGMLQLSGSFAFVKGPTMDVKLSDGSTKNVSIMSIGFNDIYAFAGLGPYWLDSNKDNRIDESDAPADDAIGLALENMDGGFMLMRSTDPLDLGVWLALSLSIQKVGLVGIPILTLEANSLKVEMNVGLGVTSGVAAVDFKASFAASGDTPAGYPLETGSEPLYLVFEGFHIAIQGQVKIYIEIAGAKLVTLDATVDFKVTETEFLFFVDGNLFIGPPDSPVIGMEATGLVYASSGGLAIYFDLSVSAGVSGIIQFKGDSTFYLNTFGTDIIYTVPEAFRAAVGFDSLTIPAGAPLREGGNATAGSYMVVMASGELIIAGLVTSGEVYLSANFSEGKFDFYASLDWFGVITVTIEGYIKADGGFLIQGEVTLDIDFVVFGLSGGLGVRISNDSQPYFAAWVWGDIKLLGATVASVRGEIALYAASASVTLSATVNVPIFGKVSKTGTVVWSWGPDPILATKLADGSLRLNVGQDRMAREVDPDDPYFDEVADESYTVEHVSGSAGNETVKIKALGYSAEFSGISRILANNAEDGTDYFELDTGILVDANIHGGDGNDTLINEGTGKATF